MANNKVGYQIKDNYFKLATNNYQGVSVTLECKFAEDLTQDNIDKYFDSVKSSVDTLLEVVKEEI